MKRVNRTPASVLLAKAVAKDRPRQNGPSPRGSSAAMQTVRGGFRADPVKASDSALEPQRPLLEQHLDAIQAGNSILANHVARLHDLYARLCPELDTREAAEAPTDEGLCGRLQDATIGTHRLLDRLGDIVFKLEQIV